MVRGNSLANGQNSDEEHYSDGKGKTFASYERTDRLSFVRSHLE